MPPRRTRRYTWRHLSFCLHLNDHLVQSQQAQRGLEESEPCGNIQHGVDHADRLIQNAPRVRHVVRDRECATIKVGLAELNCKQCFVSSEMSAVHGRCNSYEPRAMLLSAGGQHVWHVDEQRPGVAVSIFGFVYVSLVTVKA